MLGPILAKIRQRAEQKGFALFEEGEKCLSCNMVQCTTKLGPPYKYICPECNKVHCVFCTVRSLNQICEDCEKASAI